MAYTFCQKMMLHRTSSIVTSVLLALAVLSVEATMMFLVEAADDGWDLQDPTPIVRLATSVAPFGLFPLVTAIIAGFATLASMWDQRVRLEVILIITLLFAISFTGFAVTAQVVRPQLNLDGWLGGTPAAWVLHTMVTILLAVYAFRRIRDRKAEQAGSGQPATRPESKSEGSDKPQPEAEGRSR